MGITFTEQTQAEAIDAAAAFNAAATAKYTALFLTVGKGPFSYGQTEFRSYGQLRKDIDKTCQTYEIDPSGITARFGHDHATFQFASKQLYNQFMDAMIGKHVERNTLVVQVGGKSPEWHNAVGRHIKLLNRVREEEHPGAKPITVTKVPSYGGTLIDYNFPDYTTMKDFYAALESGQFDLRVRHVASASHAAMQSASI